MALDNYHYGQHANMNYPLYQYPYNGNNPALSVSNSTKVSARFCPTRAANGSGRTHMHGRREEEHETGQRRRVAVACARCRKRKIRCSGDPGDGSACQNCNAAGVDPKLCAFHRVGSGEATSMIDLHNFNQIANSQAFMLYSSPASPVRARPATYPPALDTKSAYPQTPWYSSPYDSGETSPVETYSLDQSTAYLPAPNPMSYNGNYDWTSDNRPTQSTYLGHDPSINGLPCLQHNIRAAVSSEALSNSMGTLQLAMSERPNTRSGLAASQRPQLPIPQPSPAQATRNVVDRLQDQRLRSARSVGGSFSLNMGGFVKPLLPATSDVDVQIISTTADAIAGQSSTAISATTTDSVACYPILAPASTQELSVSTAPQFTFSTSSLLDGMTTTSQPVYSNFRDRQDYKATSSPCTKTDGAAIRQISQSDHYSIGNSSSGLNSSAGEGSTLVSGQRYTPLSHTQGRPQHQTTPKVLTKKAAFSVHQAPRAAVGNRNF